MATLSSLNASPSGHCLNNYKVRENITARVGSTFKESGGTVYRIKEAILHPNFNSIKLDNDVALLIVEGEIMFDANVKPIALPKLNQVVADGTVCTVSGWGLWTHRTPLLNSVSYSLTHTHMCPFLR
jgi:trypsin